MWLPIAPGTMQKPIQTKITDIKFNVIRLRQECLQQGYPDVAERLDDALAQLEKAILCADLPTTDATHNKP